MTQNDPKLAKMIKNMRPTTTTKVTFANKENWSTTSWSTKPLQPENVCVLCDRHAVLMPRKKETKHVLFRSVTYLRNLICCWDEYFSMLKFPLIVRSPFISYKWNVMSRITGLSKFCIFDFCAETALNASCSNMGRSFIPRTIENGKSWSFMNRKWLGVYFPCKIAHTKLLHNLRLPII